MLALWVALRNAAPVIGGAIIFGINSSINASGAVSLDTYLAIIGIMCAGPFIALLLSHPRQVQRKDGAAIVFRETGWLLSLSEWWSVVASKNVSETLRSDSAVRRADGNLQMLLLCPLFFTSWFYGSYIGRYLPFFLRQTMLTRI